MKFIQGFYFCFFDFYFTKISYLFIGSYKKKKPFAPKKDE